MTENLGVVGLGMGYAWATLLASQGYNVTGLDIDPEAVENPRKDRSVEELFKEKGDEIEKNLVLTTDYEDISDSDMVFIVVSALYDEEKRQLDIGPVESALRSTAQFTDAKICSFSTLPYGAHEKLSSISEYCYVPEMVAQGKYVDGFKNPPFLALGATNEELGEEVKMFYRDLFSSLQVEMPPIYKTSPEVAEMIKLVANAFLTTKITFANTVGALGEKLNTDANRALEIIGNDPRIGHEFLNAGYAFGGPCFPRDLPALISTYEKYDAPSNLLKTVENFNRKRALDPIKVLEEKQFLEEPKSIAVLGLAYKEGISDTRGSPSLDLLDRLEGAKHNVKTYDPNLSGGEDLGEFLSELEIVIVTNSEPSFEELGSLVGENCEVICDFTGIVDSDFVPSGVNLFKVGKGWIK